MTEAAAPKATSPSEKDAGEPGDRRPTGDQKKGVVASDAGARAGSGIQRNLGRPSMRKKKRKMKTPRRMQEDAAAPTGRGDVVVSTVTRGEIKEQ